MPTVLLLTYHFPPSAASGAFRLLGFTRHLPAHGWSTVVVAPPSLPWEPVDASLATRVPPDTVVHHVPYPSGLPRVVRWFAPYAVWLPYARSAAFAAVKKHRPDVVLTSGPPHWIHLLGRSVQKKFRLPWAADFRDPWITLAFLGAPSGWKRSWELYWERQVMKHADLILCNAPGACSGLQAAYPRQAGKMTVLTNGYDPEDFPPPSQERSPGPVRILHAGQLYAGRDPRPLLQALVGLEEVAPFRLEFLGRTEYEKGADLMTDARALGVADRVACLGQASYAQTLQEMARADVLLLMDTPGRKIGVPAKLYEYLGAGRPILATGGEDGDLAAILKQSGISFRIVPPHDPARIRDAIRDMVAGVAGGAIGPASEAQRLRFSRRELAGELAAHLQGLLSRRTEKTKA